MILLQNLKENELLITETIDEAEFYDYIEFIDIYQSTFDISKRIIHFSEFIESQGRNKNSQKFVINKTESIEYETTSIPKSLNSSVQNKSENLKENKIALNSTSQTNQLKIASNEGQQKVQANKYKDKKIYENEMKSQKKLMKLNNK